MPSGYSYRVESQQISNCDNLLYSEYFYSFLSSEEHNEAVSHIKLSRYDEAHPLLEVNRLTDHLGFIF